MSSAIRGVDLVQEVPAGAFDAKVLLAQVLDYWPEGVFQQADEERFRPLEAVVEEEAALTADEFFVYQDQASADSWGRDGWTPENRHSMLHFLVQRAGGADPVKVTVVLEELAGEVAEIGLALAALLQEMRESAGRRLGRLNVNAELRAAGSALSRARFYDLVDEVRRALYPDWTRDDLACRPHDALQFCEVVRRKAGAPLPDSLIMRALLSRRPRPRR